MKELHSFIIILFVKWLYVSNMPPLEIEISYIYGNKYEMNLGKDDWASLTCRVQMFAMTLCNTIFK